MGSGDGGGGSQPVATGHRFTFDEDEDEDDEDGHLRVGDICQRFSAELYSHKTLQLRLNI